MRRWQLQEAKARLSEVVRAAEEGGPQEITLRGEGVAVVLGRTRYDRLSSRRGSLAEFVRRSPLGGVALDVRRLRAGGRRRKA